MEISLIEELIRNLSDRYSNDELGFFVKNGFIQSRRCSLVLLRTIVVNKIRRSKGKMKVMIALLARWEYLREQKWKQRALTLILDRILQKWPKKAFLLAASWNCEIEVVCDELEFPRGRAPPPEMPAAGWIEKSLAVFIVNIPFGTMSEKHKRMNIE